MMGNAGLKDATAVAVLSANYIAKKLEHAYPLLYTGKNGLIAHECIIDIRGITKATGVTGEDIRMLIPHQANVRIITAACDRLGIEAERTAVVLDRTGNTSAASIPLALIDAIDAGRLADGDLVLLVGFGGGMTAASAIIRWGGSQ